MKKKNAIPENKNKTFAYLRVSASEQDIEKKKTDISKFANDRNFGAVHFVEEKVSGVESWKKLKIKNIIDELERIRNANPRMGIVILIVFYSSQDIELLRRLALCGESGMALFLKQSLDKIEQLCRTIIAVSQGQVILDPPLATFMFAGKPESPFLKQLTTRELEILSLLSQGYTNSSIADTLFIDIKTVEHHLNSMYSKLKTDPDYNTKHLRVSAARLYLESMGTLYQKDESMPKVGAR